jgi:hypothetical protein
MQETPVKYYPAILCSGAALAPGPLALVCASCAVHGAEGDIAPSQDCMVIPKEEGFKHTIYDLALSYISLYV